MNKYLRFIEHCRKKNYHPSEYLEKHHIVPRHDGGGDNEENLIRLSLKDHIIAHKIRYEIYGNKYDLAASSYMSGQSAEAKKAICSANGSKSKGRKLTEEHKNKLSKPGELNPFYGKKHTEETKKIISKKARDRKWTEKAKQKLSATLKSRKDITRPRRCKIEEQEYFSISEASRLLDISTSLLRYRLNSLNWKEYIWLDPPSENKQPSSSKKVLIDGKEYSSLAQAGSILGLHPKTISKRCQSQFFSNYSFVEAC